MLPAIAIVGGGIPIAAGCALSFKFRKKNNVAVSFFGEGATNEGVWHESLNMAAIWNLPVIFVCENNLYGASTHVTKIMKIRDIAERAAAYGMPGVVVDGNDAAAVYRATAEAVNRARSGGGPTLLECKTYRRGGHSRGDSNLYRDKEEEKVWLGRDPIVIIRNKLKEMGILADPDVKRIEEEARAQIDAAIAFAEASPFPAPEDTLKNLWVE